MSKYEATVRETVQNLPTNMQNELLRVFLKHLDAGVEIVHAAQLAADEFTEWAAENTKSGDPELLKKFAGNVAFAFCAQFTGDVLVQYMKEFEAGA